MPGRYYVVRNGQFTEPRRYGRYARGAARFAAAGMGGALTQLKPKSVKEAYDYYKYAKELAKDAQVAYSAMRSKKKDSKQSYKKKTPSKTQKKKKTSFKKLKKPIGV